MVSDTTTVVTQSHATNVPNTPGTQVIHTLTDHKINVMVLDYHDIFLNGFVKLLGIYGFNVIAYSNDAGVFKELLTLYSSSTDIVIVNFKITRRQTFDVAEYIKDVFPHLKVVLNTIYTCTWLNDRIKKLGIDGVILKNDFDKDQIISTLQGVYNSFRTC